MSKLHCVTALALCFLIQPAFAQSLGEKEKYAYEEKQMVSQVTDVNKHCKTDIQVKFDWTTFKKEELTERSPNGFCQEVFSGIRTVCTGSEAGMKAVQEKIKSVTCKKSTTHSFSLNNGELVYNIEYNTPNINEAAVKFLKDNL